MWKVLIVDDEPKIRRGLKKWVTELKLPFCVIGEAGNSAEALKIAQEKEPHVFFVDINMPHVNGLDLIRQLKSKFSQAVIIVISGYDYFEYARQAIRLQVYDYLLKPVPKTDFYQIMKKINGELTEKFSDLNVSNEKGIEVNRIADEEQNYSAIVSRVKEYIHNNYQDPELSLPKAANMLNINKTYLSKLMKNQLGYSFIEYVTEIRISKAKELLKEDMLDVKMYEIAQKVGFRSQHYFSRVFKNNQGLSPLDYRNKN